MTERRASERRQEVAMALIPVLLAVVSLVILVDPRVPVATINSSLDIAINTGAVLVAVAVALLGWIHFREARDAAALLRASAFLVLAVTNILTIAASVAGVSPAFGLDLRDPGQLPVLATVVDRAVACALLLLAGVAALRRWNADHWPVLLVLWLPALLLVALLAGAATIQPSLPQIIGPNELAALRAEPTEPLVVFGARLLVGVQVAIGIGYLGAAALAYWSFRRDLRSLDAFFAIGLIVAAFSQVQFAIHPGVYTSLVTVGDLLRVLFYAILLLALASESRDDIRALRRANSELAVLREADLAHATAEERARLAREIHDGMSQELWFAKLKQARLAELDLPPEGRVLAGEVADALDAALAEARQAILALQPAETGSFGQVLERFVADFSDRFGIPAECVWDSAGESISSRTQAELLRIVHEALTNARRHADPTLVRVAVGVKRGTLRLTVADNGRGFDLTLAHESRYGLTSMRERAELIGGRFSVETAPRGGTTVLIEVPIEGPLEAAR